ncbi:FAD-binding domain-containing protein [Biscogniauxia marginata]|nr:FAD-binding domain-containing protein [Biscogniauxia marginata]
MAAITDIKSALPPTCDVSTPSNDDDVHKFLSKRWMTLGPSTLPAAAVVPSTEDDVVAVVRFAAANGLRVLPSCGACGGVVIINNKTLYLDMEKVRSVDVNTEARTVTLGGGALTGDVQPVVTSRGFYTGWPNIGIVGMVGNVLLGGINLLMVIMGHACDNLVGARLVTASGEIVEVSASSSGSKRDLYNVLKGAGAGFGVVLSLTLRIYPTTDLSLVDGNKISEVVAMFAKKDFDAAAKLWEILSQSKDHGPLSAGFVLMAAPPTMSNAGEPIIVAQGSYPGPASEAEKAFAPWNAPEIQEKAIMVKPGLTDLNTMNAQRDAMTTKGKNMDCYNGLVKELSAETFLRGANRFAAFVEAYGANIGRTMTVFQSMPSATLTSIDGAGESFMCHRDRRFLVQTMAWDLKPEHIPAGVAYGKDVLNIARSEDKEKGVPNAILGGNGRVQTDMAEIYSAHKLEILRRVKKEWDPNGVFWSPAVDGWVY